MKCKWLGMMLMLMLCTVSSFAQQGESMYGDVVKADVKMKYVYTLEDAFSQSRKTGKPIFFNCFADWAIPCHGMNKEVFSNKEFCDYMDKNFVCLFMDLSKRENESIAKKYEVKSFAHYLVLDSDGNVVLRIVGGMRLPDFQYAVARALSPKTSLVGTEKLYQSGKRDKKTLANYLEALNLAHKTDQFKAVGKEYMAMLKPKEYSKEENWKVFTSWIPDRKSDNYKYLLEHKADFVKNVGADKVNMFMEGLFYWDVLSYATAYKDYDAMDMAQLFNEMQKAELPDSCDSYSLYKVAQLRGAKKYSEMLDYLRTQGKALGASKIYVDMSLNKIDADEQTKNQVLAFLREEQKQYQGTHARRLEDLIRSMENTGGVEFADLTFDQALAQAAKTGKLVFMDCYTDWCVPCRHMAKEVFTLPQVGGYFNEHFVNLKMDMEKGEGVQLAKRYNISAYPTMLVLDAKGNVLKTVLGARKAEELLQMIRVDKK